MCFEKQPSRNKFREIPLENRGLILNANAEIKTVPELLIL